MVDYIVQYNDLQAYVKKLLKKLGLKKKDLETVADVIIDASLKGIDSLLSTIQMPGGVPVACMAIGKAGAKNAAVLALQILALNDKRIANKLLIYKRRLASLVKAK